jgi:hypothetical protein
MPDMRQITDARVPAPGLAVVEVAAADDATAFAIHELLAAHYAVGRAADGRWLRLMIRGCLGDTAVRRLGRFPVIW